MPGKGNSLALRIWISFRLRTQVLFSENAASQVLSSEDGVGGLSFRIPISKSVNVWTERDLRVESVSVFEEILIQWQRASEGFRRIVDCLSSTKPMKPRSQRYPEQEPGSPCAQMACRGPQRSAKISGLIDMTHSECCSALGFPKIQAGPPMYSSRQASFCCCNAKSLVIWNNISSSPKTFISNRQT